MFNYTANVSIDYQKANAHDLFVADLNQKREGFSFIGDGHPADGSTDLDFEAESLSMVKEFLTKLKQRHPTVLQQIHAIL